MAEDENATDDQQPHSDVAELYTPDTLDVIFREGNIPAEYREKFTAILYEQAAFFIDFRGMKPPAPKLEEVQKLAANLRQKMLELDRNPLSELGWIELAAGETRRQPDEPEVPNIGVPRVAAAVNAVFDLTRWIFLFNLMKHFFNGLISNARKKSKESSKR